MYAYVCFDVCFFLSFLELTVLLLTDTKPDLFSQLEKGGGGGGGGALSIVFLSKTWGCDIYRFILMLSSHS